MHVTAATQATKEVTLIERVVVSRGGDASVQVTQVAVRGHLTDEQVLQLLDLRDRTYSAAVWEM
jgi:hypothetical protein